MKVIPVLTRLYPFSRIQLNSNRKVALSMCASYEPDSDGLRSNECEGLSQPGNEKAHAAATEFRSGSMASIADGFASQCGYVYNAEGALIHGLTHKYRPVGDYKPLSRMCQKAAGKRRTGFGFTYLQGDVAVATASTQRYYYHWMVDVLPRIEMIRGAGFKGLVYMDAALPYQRDTVDRLWPDAPIVDAQSRPLITADRLIVPVHQVSAVQGFPGWIADLLRERILGRHARPEPSSYPERIYIVRNRAARRCLTNEREVCDKLAAYGFHCLAMEDMTVEDQAKHFFNAELIVAPHGGGLANLVFCHAGARCVELFGQRDSKVYKDICRAVGVEYRKLNGFVEEGERGRFHEDFSIDPDSVIGLLETMGVSRKSGENQACRN